MILYQNTLLREIACVLGLKNTRQGYQGSCPSCNYPSGFSIKEDRGKFLVYCHAGGCSFKEISETLKKYGLWHSESKTGSFKNYPAVIAKAAVVRPGFKNTAVTPSADCDSYKQKRFIRSLWEQSTSVKGTLVEAYLRNRGIIIPIPDNIRFLPNILHKPTGSHYPVMLSKVSFSNDPNQIALHRTFLKWDDSGKAEICPNKMILGNVRGGSVHFAQPKNVLAISEGIESSLSVYQATYIPTWAALSTGGMKSLILPNQVQQLFIYADNDSPGLKAAYDAAEKFSLEGKVVKVVVPPITGWDFNDVLRAEK